MWYSFNMVNVGEFTTLVTSRANASACVNLVFPTPSGPFNAMTALSSIEAANARARRSVAAISRREKFDSVKVEVVSAQDECEF